MKDLKTTIVGVVLIACGAFLIITEKHASPESLAIVSAGAGFIAAADSKK